VLAISEDTPDDSRAFAGTYHISFPLLSDDGHVARSYTGVTSDANALPGVVFVARDGTIVHRQVATAKDDRMTAPEILATADRVFGTSGPAVPDRGYAALDRFQLRVDAGGGTTVAGEVAALHPLGRYLLAGPQVGLDLHHVDLDIVVIARVPIWGRLGAIELGAAGGYTPSSTWNVSARGGLWFAYGPRWSIQLGASTVIHEDRRDVIGAIGVARLLSR
jgi:hypothetical protein